MPPVPAPGQLVTVRQRRCPAGLQLQWRDQMRDKFGLEFRIVDSELQRELRRRRGPHIARQVAKLQQAATAAQTASQEKP